MKPFFYDKRQSIPKCMFLPRAKRRLSTKLLTNSCEQRNYLSESNHRASNWIGSFNKFGFLHRGLLISSSRRDKPLQLLPNEKTQEKVLLFENSQNIYDSGNKRYVPASITSSLPKASGWDSPRLLKGFRNIPDKCRGSTTATLAGIIQLVINPNSKYFTAFSNDTMRNTAKCIRRQRTINMPTFLFEIIGNFNFSSVDRIV